LPWTERSGADSPRTAAALWPRLCLSRAARRHGEAALGRSRWPLSVSEAARTRAIYMASSCKRFGLADASAALDAARRHRLEKTCADGRAGDERLSCEGDSVQCSCAFYAFNRRRFVAYFAHG